jgi:hypothetical protein
MLQRPVPCHVDRTGLFDFESFFCFLGKSTLQETNLTKKLLFDPYVLKYAPPKSKLTDNRQKPIITCLKKKSKDLVFVLNSIDPPLDFYFLRYRPNWMLRI